MQYNDPHTAARVWDRVQNTAIPAADAQFFPPLISELLLDAQNYRQLARKLPPSQANAVRQLATREQAQALCLKGIYTMITGEAVSVPPSPVSDDPAQILLRRCYGHQMRRISLYGSRQGDPQYGQIFRSLARESQEHCRRILEILGALAK